jgi:hypothetical protein
MTQKQKRNKKEAGLFKKGDPIPQPTLEDLHVEQREEAPHLIFTIRDESGNVVRRLTQRAGKGINRATWDLRYANTTQVRVSNDTFSPVAGGGRGGRRGGGAGALAMPGKYSVSMAMSVDGKITELAGPVEFNAVTLNNTTLPAADRAELVAFQKEVAETARVVQGTMAFTQELIRKTEYIKQAVYATPQGTPELMDRARDISAELDKITILFNGLRAGASREETPPQPVSINSRLRNLIYSQWRSTSGVTQNQRNTLAIIKEEFPPVLEKIKQINQDIKAIEIEIEKIGAPWTPGRVPEWIE